MEKMDPASWTVWVVKEVQNLGHERAARLPLSRVVHSSMGIPRKLGGNGASQTSMASDLHFNQTQ